MFLYEVLTDYYDYRSRDEIAVCIMGIVGVSLGCSFVWFFVWLGAILFFSSAKLCIQWM